MVEPNVTLIGNTMYIQGPIEPSTVLLHQPTVEELEEDRIFDFELRAVTPTESGRQQIRRYAELAAAAHRGEIAFDSAELQAVDDAIIARLRAIPYPTDAEGVRRANEAINRRVSRAR